MCDEGDALAVYAATIALCGAVLTQIPKIGDGATDLHAGTALAANFSRLHYVEILYYGRKMKIFADKTKKEN